MICLWKENWVKARAIAFATLCLAPVLSANAQTPLTGDANFAEAALLQSKAPGAYCVKTRPTRHTFEIGSPLVSAGYAYSPEAITATATPDTSLYRHPAPLPSYASARNPAGWHYYQLKAMRTAGLNVVLPVYRGNPIDDVQPKASLHWANAGLAHLVQATASLNREKRGDLHIGMFYDTATLTHYAAHPIDLSTPDGRAWFYVTIRNFYSRIPPALRATVDGKPLVVLPPTDYEKSHAVGDARLLNYARTRFQNDFGMELYLVAHDVWQFPNADAVMRGDSRDPNFTGGVVAFSPGWRNPPWSGPLNPDIDRARGDNGSRYRDFWKQLLALAPTARPNFVLIDSWNEWTNDTAIAPSREYGDLYVRLTRQLAKPFLRQDQLTRR